MNRSQIIQSAQRDKLGASSGSTGYGEWALAFGRIEEISYEDHIAYVTVNSKESDRRDARPVILTFPFSGRRSIMGGMPERGDFVLVGYALDDAMAGSRQPVILAYLGPTPWMGHDHVMSSDLSDVEGMATPEERASLDGSYERVRQKLRHYDPGNIFASSSQGSDLVLDESVTLANRRGSEFVLRDADETSVLRSVAGHEAFAGVRTYSGPVSRTARTLPTQMFSDGLYWDSLNQILPEESTPITDQYLRAHSGMVGSDSDTYKSPVPQGFLNPSYVFLRSNGENAFETETGRSFPADLDPYRFLFWGGFCTSTGAQTSESPDLVYGGRVLNRVGLDEENRVVNAAGGGSALTEHRVEVFPVTDQTLPVTEGTDALDSDKMPGEPTGITPLDNSPYVEFVIGSVVGNDPFSQQGQALYGLPLSYSLFSNGTPSPRFTSAELSEIGRHLAMLLKVRPLDPESIGDTVFTIDKSGALKIASFGNPSNPSNVEIHSNTGLMLSADGTLKLRAIGGFEFQGGASPSGYGLNLTSEGGVLIKSNGPIMEGSQQSPQPDLRIQAQDQAEISASQQVVIQAPKVSVRNANQIELQSLTTIQLQAGEGIAQSSKTYTRTTTGKSTEVFGGPVDGLITNGPVREVNIIANPATGFVGGVNDKYQNIYGDRDELFLLGNHTTQCVVGNLTYATAAGVVTARSLANQTQWSPAGITTTATSGSVSTTALAGAIAHQSTIASTYKTTGAMSVSGAAVLLLGGPGKVGPIVCGSDLDPLTGLPLIALGMGSPGHILTTPS